ncbi:hypothetical protein BpHYR1_034451 [Brachionus plicatilis]|uniref:Uncharacterized protein n=1 Tax=Brachionus plicatilis TaxID=10195 RepID=A0A3M7SC58_BRAPC|nr:hypothetical protein BpHYR1_034451 [Brachionus plicatilis]
MRYSKTSLRYGSSLQITHRKVLKKEIMSKYELRLQIEKAVKKNFINKCSCSRFLTRPEGIVSVLELVGLLIQIYDLNNCRPITKRANTCDGWKNSIQIWDIISYFKSNSGKVFFRAVPNEFGVLMIESKGDCFWRSFEAESPGSPELLFHDFALR